LQANYGALPDIDRSAGDERGVAQSSWDLGLLLEAQGDLERPAPLMQRRPRWHGPIGAGARRSPNSFRYCATIDCEHGTV
jgi:hypothetical protein